ncbi:MAG: hypothetical protein JWM87_1800 [Candidatus Eremiobacteraeota bacterium]|nr:hypothetical protein [Candidatus Eremiobacteraeota bacterium]
MNPFGGREAGEMPEQPQYPIDKAKRSIRVLNAVVERLLLEHPCRVVVDRDIQSARAMKPLAAFFVATNENFDGVIRPLVGDVFVNLHAALDAAIRAKVQEKGADITGVRFPVIDRPGDLDTAVRGASVHRAGPEVERFVRDLHAYPTGTGENIWAACRLGVNLAHRQDVAFLTYMVTVRGIKSAAREAAVRDIVRQPARHGAKLVSPLPEEHYELGIDIKPDEVTVALSEGGPLETLPLLEVANNSSAAVSRVLDGIRDL